MVSGIFIDRNIAPGQDACGVLQTKLCNYMQTFNTCICKHIHMLREDFVNIFYMHNNLKHLTLHKDTSGFVYSCNPSPAIICKHSQAILRCREIPVETFTRHNYVLRDTWGRTSWTSPSLRYTFYLQTLQYNLAQIQAAFCMPQAVKDNSIRISVHSTFPSNV